MLKTRLLATSAISSLFALAATSAQAGTSLEIFGGASFFGDDSLSTSTSTGFTTFTTRVTISGVVSAAVDKKVGYNVGGIIGYQFDNNFGLGVELAYRRTNFTLSPSFSGTFATYWPCPGPCVLAFSTPVAATGSGSGRLSSFALMADAFYEFKTKSRLSPYVEAGIGVAWNKITKSSVAVTVAGPPPAGPPFASGTLTHTTTLNTSPSGKLAWQAGGGVNIALSEKVALTVGYRYFDGGDINTVGGKIEAISHDVKGGLKIKY